MGLFNLHFFGDLFKTEKTAAGVAKGAEIAKSAEIARGAEITKAATIEKTAAEISTRTKAAESTGSVFARQAKEIASSKIVTTAAKVGAGAVVVGGATYAIGKLGGQGMQDLGYSFRNLTNSSTPQDLAKQNLDFAKEQNQIDQEKLNLLQDYKKFLNTQAMDDSPSTREAYQNYVLGSPEEDTAGTKGGAGSNNASSWIIGGGLVALAAIVGYSVLKKKKGKAK